MWRDACNRCLNQKYIRALLQVHWSSKPLAVTRALEYERFAGTGHWSALRPRPGKTGTCSRKLPIWPVFTPVGVKTSS